jgi:hypothetical protein
VMKKKPRTKKINKYLERWERVEKTATERLRERRARANRFNYPKRAGEPKPEPLEQSLMPKIETEKTGAELQGAALQCECGARVARAAHATWCPLFKDAFN